MGLRAVVFDFDGTILDTETPEWEGYSGLYRRHGLELPLSLWQERIGTHGGPDPWEPFLGHPELEAMRREHRAGFVDRLTAMEPREGVVALLEEARSVGVLLAVASSSDRAWVAGHLGRLGLLGHFPVLATKEDVARVKPDPALYRVALERLGVGAGEAVAVEDSRNGALAALAAGMRCVVTPNGATETMAFPAGALVVERVPELAGLRGLFAPLPGTRT